MHRRRGRLIDIGYHMADEGTTAARSVLIQRLREAQKNLAGQMTLAKLATFGDQAG